MRSDGRHQQGRIRLTVSHSGVGFGVKDVELEVEVEEPVTLQRLMHGSKRKAHVQAGQAVEAVSGTSWPGFHPGSLAVVKITKPGRVLRGARPTM